MTAVLVAGALANKPGNGGEAWVRLSWLLGLRRLGVEAWLVEQIDPEVCRDELGRRAAPERSVNLAWFEQVTRRFGWTERAALIRPDGGVIAGWAGIDSEALREVAAAAELLVNISGNLTADSLLPLPGRRAYVDLDPGYTQLWHDAGVLGGALERHEELLTVGLGLEHTTVRLPLAGLRWRAAPPPVVLTEWPAMTSEHRTGAGAKAEAERAKAKTEAAEDEARTGAQAGGGVGTRDGTSAGDGASAGKLTTVASWRGGYGRVERDGHLYGQKAHQFRRFADVPRQSVASFEAALDIHPDDSADAQLLAAGGWELVDPGAVAGDADAFRDYVQSSMAEFSPAQGIYVETGCGWLGDRTARYLASGRPAIVQDVGLAPHMPLGEGLLAFATPAEALARVEEVVGDYSKHARAARRIAEERLDSDVVLGGLLEDLLG